MRCHTRLSGTPHIELTELRWRGCHTTHRLACSRTFLGHWTAGHLWFQLWTSWTTGSPTDSGWDYNPPGQCGSGCLPVPTATRGLYFVDSYLSQHSWMLDCVCGSVWPPHVGQLRSTSVVHSYPSLQQQIPHTFFSLLYKLLVFPIFLG